MMKSHFLSIVKRISLGVVGPELCTEVQEEGHFIEIGTHKNRFGYLGGDGWLGVEKLHRLTKHNSAELLISLYDEDSKLHYPSYKSFQVDSEATKYQLDIHWKFYWR